MRKIDCIVLHHSLTVDGPVVSWDAIRKYHINDHGWRDIGYHLGVEIINNRYETLIGRPWNLPGAHAPGANANSLGICLIGDFDKNAVPLEQWDYTLNLVGWLCETFNINYENVKGHRDVTAERTCPGKNFDLAKFRESL